MKREEIFATIRSGVAAHYDMEGPKTRGVPGWLLLLKDCHYDAIRFAVTDSPRVVEDMLPEMLLICVLCMHENGLVDRGYAPVVERTIVRGETDLTYILNAIIKEREYQDKLGRERTDWRVKDVEEYITMFDTYLRRAIDAWTENPGVYHALDNVRKLAGILVHCFEDMN